MISQTELTNLHQIYTIDWKAQQHGTQRGYHFTLSYLPSNIIKYKIVVPFYGYSILDEDYTEPQFERSVHISDETTPTVTSKELKGILAYSLTLKLCQPFKITTVEELDRDLLIQTSPTITTPPAEFTHPIIDQITQDKLFLDKFNEAFECVCPDLLAIFHPHLRDQSQEELINEIKLIWNALKDENNNQIICNLNTISRYLHEKKTLDEVARERTRRNELHRVLARGYRR